MSVQTAVNNFPAVGVAGELVDSTDSNDVISGKAAASSTFVPGTFIVLDETSTATGDSDVAVRLVAATGDVTSAYLGLGFVVQQTFGGDNSTSASANYSGPCVLPVMRSGRMWVVTEEAVAVGDDVYIRFAAGAGGTQLGAVRSSADTASAALLPNAVFLTKAGAAGLAMVQFR
jgi:hypothetical protein